MFAIHVQLLCLNVSECALCIDLVLLYIGTSLYHVGDVFNKVVLHSVIRKIKENVPKFFSLYLFTFEVFDLWITPMPKKYLCSKISLNNPWLLFSERKLIFKRLTTVWSAAMNCAVERSHSKVY